MVGMTRKRFIHKASKVAAYRSNGDVAAAISILVKENACARQYWVDFQKTCTARQEGNVLREITKLVLSYTGGIYEI